MRVRKSTIAVLGKGIIPYLQLSKPVLLTMIIKSLKTLPKERLALIAYEIVKSKLPRLRKTYGKYQLSDFGKRKLTLKELMLRDKSARLYKRKTKRKFSRKQLAAQRLFAKRARAGTLRRR